uniref:Uncharacterized protein n=1 Tax=Moorena producens (strain JHB) TaxID=1454205 RepID=A0A1D9FWM6_MOOP1
MISHWWGAVSIQRSAVSSQQSAVSSKLSVTQIKQMLTGFLDAKREWGKPPRPRCIAYSKAVIVGCP